MKNSLIPIFIVSLPNSKRRSILKKKLKEMQYEFIDAVYGKNFLSEVDRINSFSTAPRRYERLISSGEYGCTVSHLNIYKKIVSEDIEWAIILEDDVDFDFDFQIQLSQIVNKLDSNSLYILGSQEGLNSFDNIVLSKRNEISYMDISFKKILNSHRYIYRTASYLISKKTALNILKFTENDFYLADDWYSFYNNQIFDKIYLGDFVHHPVILEGQSLIETDRKYKDNYAIFKILGIYDLLRKIKSLIRKFFIPFLYDK